MNSGSAPQTTRSSTTMPTRSMPTVSCLSSAWAIAELGADAVGAAREQRARYSGVEAEQAGEPAEPADDLRAAGPRHPRHQLDGAVAGVDVDAGRGVRGVAHGAPPRRRRARPPSTASMWSTVARPLCTDDLPRADVLVVGAVRRRAGGPRGLGAMPRGRACRSGRAAGSGSGRSRRSRRGTAGRRAGARGGQPLERDEARASRRRSTRGSPRRPCRTAMSSARLAKSMP